MAARLSGLGNGGRAMSRKAYTEINLHVTWHVKDDAPVLRDEIETQVHRTLRGQAVNEPGVFLHEIGGTDDHVHRW
jgi:REP element-mobilizing transposase RayT